MSNIIIGVNKFLDEGYSKLKKHLEDNSLKPDDDIKELEELFDFITDEEKDTNEYVIGDSSKSPLSGLFGCKIYLPAIYHKIIDKHFALSDGNKLEIEYSNFNGFLLINDHGVKSTNLKIRLMKSLHISHGSPVFNILPNLFDVYACNIRDIVKTVSFFSILYYDVHALETKDKYTREIEKEVSKNDDEELFNFIKDSCFIKLDRLGLKNDINYKELVQNLKSIAIPIIPSSF